MTKNLISWLLLLATFSFMLHSCVHDEMSTSADPSSKEYHSKSLWKEDEKYIKNVMQVYLENETRIRKVSGEPLWDYAMTMGYFDESFLMVPIKSSNKVVSVLSVQRIEGKIYFNYSDNKEYITFFQRYLFSTRKKVQDNQEASLASRMECNTKAISTWYPDNENDPEGSGHWGTTTVTICKPIKEMSNCYKDSLGNCITEGGDGYPYPGDGGGGNPETEIPEDPCTKTKTLVNKPQIKEKLKSLKEHANTNTKDEAGFQELKSGTLQQGTVTADNSIFFGIGSNSLGTVHTHQPQTIGMFAPQDVMTFLAIVREQNANALGNAYSGMVSGNGTYFINFTGTASDLPPAMTEAEEATFVARLVLDYKKEYYKLLKNEGKLKTEKLSDAGLEKLFFDTLNKTSLSGKVALIKENNGSTSTIQFNSDGTPKTPNPC
ncbi:hypothetical protein [Chryseobacterium sp.]|uniref:hypothetical protein n=1 Tax=Chryseobacterium sp. TaxID=1871047 RepID=UPI002899F852|nr:hypothetical protein [Chryseobacterium sp.]